MRQLYLHTEHWKLCLFCLIFDLVVLTISDCDSENVQFILKWLFNKLAVVLLVNSLR